MDLSLNMMRLREVPACMELNGCKGKIGYQVFSSGVVCGLIRRHARQLGIPGGCELPKALSEKLAAPQEAVRKEAEQLADELGRRLALVFYNAKEVYPNRQGLPDRERESAECFRLCRRLILGGGLAAGPLGERITASANRALKEAGAELLLVRHPYPQYMPLLGCAMRCPEGNSLVFDFGQTYVKSAVARISPARACTLRVREKRPSQFVRRDYAFSAQKRREAKKLDRLIQEHIVGAVEQMRGRGLELSGAVVISLAAKFEGTDLLPYGAYGKLEAVYPQYLSGLQARITQETGCACRLAAISDETAASLAVGEQDALVVTLGTAFGLQKAGLAEAEAFSGIQVVRSE